MIFVEANCGLEGFRRWTTALIMCRVMQHTTTQIELCKSNLVSIEYVVLSSWSSNYSEATSALSVWIAVSWLRLTSNLFLSLISVWLSVLFSASFLLLSLVLRAGSGLFWFLIDAIWNYVLRVFAFLELSPLSRIPSICLALGLPVCLFPLCPLLFLPLCHASFALACFSGFSVSSFLKFALQAAKTDQLVPFEGGGALYAI